MRNVNFVKTILFINNVYGRWGTKFAQFKLIPDADENSHHAIIYIKITAFSLVLYLHIDPVYLENI